MLREISQGANMQIIKHFQTILVTFFIICLVSACNNNSSDTNTATVNTVNPEVTVNIPAADTTLVTIDIDNDDIAGVVTSSNGPEAGVWVIAETDDFETRYAKVVVTDDQGQYLIPDLPEANYQVWVRGYGLLDSAKVNASRGSHVGLNAQLVPDRAAAAEIYPAAYWYAMMKMPEPSEISFLPGGLNEYLWHIKNRDCVGCHQMGNKATRTIPASLGEFPSSEAAWARRMSSGQAGNRMISAFGALQGVPFKYFADWTDRIAAGELPHEDPPRPSGLERNLVLTVRDWADPKVYLHDLSGTDERNPTVNANGPLFGAPELSTDEFPILDPVTNTDTSFTALVRDEETPSTGDNPVIAPSPYWGDEVLWDSQANAHNPMHDQDGRVWFTARIRARDNPAFCKEGSDHLSAKVFPTTRAGRQLSVYEPSTGEYKFIDTCYSTHHLQFSEDEDNTLWTSGDDFVAGWVNTKIFHETGDSAKAVGWAPFVFDTNGNGVLDEWVEPDEQVNPDLDKRFIGDTYAVMPNPADGTVWYSSVSNKYRGGVVRFDPETRLSEFFRPPLPGFGNRGAGIDRNGVIWSSMASGHLGEFDRRKCTGPLNGPEATGDHCPEGWSFHDLPGPGFIDVPDFSVESSYYTWVDQHDTLGLGSNVPMVTGNLHDGVHAFVDGKFLTLRLPYPLGFYTKGFQGRIDDPNTGWKGRGLWVPSGDRTPWHKEDGKGSRPLVVHFQMRPDPLAK
jgi:hypothetical protein